MTSLTLEQREVLRIERPARKLAAREAKTREREARPPKINTLLRDGNRYIRYTHMWNAEPTILRNTVSQTEIVRKGCGQWKIITEVQQMNTYNVDWFWRHHRDFIGSEQAAELFPNAKEISESVSAYRQLVCNGYPIGDIVLVVGDGTRPRTGSIFAGDPSHPQVYSVDPLMYPQYNKPDEKLMGFAAMIEDWLRDEGARLYNCQHLTVVAVHSHAILREYLPTIQKLLPDSCKITIVAIPCCVPQELPEGSTLVLRKESTDWGIWSNKRVVKVWTST